MVSLQILSKILQTGDLSILTDNLIDSDDYFIGYTDELHFIQNHAKEYGNVPDKATFLSKFPEIELVDVTESDRYLVETIREEYLYRKSVPVIQRAAELLKTDSNAAAEYLVTELKTLQPSYSTTGVDIIAGSDDRYNEYVERKLHQNDWFFTCGFPELDDLIHGIQRGDELFVIFARTNQGKSWILEKMCTHVWQIGFNVGYVSPEMSASSVGYRFDTLLSHYSNKSLMWGSNDVDEDSYKTYLQELKSHTNKFVVATPADFGRTITITKLRNWITNNKLDLIAIDGITYLSDERGRRGDSKTVSLTNISEDLMSLSLELRVPILVVVQANRTGVVERGGDDTPELESIRDSDGIAHNASKVISLHQKLPGVLNIMIKKQRIGPVGGKLTYNWNINTGEFTFIPSYDDAEESTKTDEGVEKLRSSYNDKTDVF